MLIKLSPEKQLPALNSPHNNENVPAKKEQELPQLHTITGFLYEWEPCFEQNQVFDYKL